MDKKKCVGVVRYAGWLSLVMKKGGVSMDLAAVIVIWLLLPLGGKGLFCWLESRYDVGMFLSNRRSN